MTFRNTSAGDGSGARWNNIRFQGTQSGGEVSDLVHLQANHDGTADDEKGAFEVLINDGNDGDSLNKRIRVDSDGLKFNSDTAAANALDDYEEGTWTPTHTNAGYTFSNSAGYYTKVGNMVHWFVHTQLSAIPNDGNPFEIHGLPYTSSSAQHNYGWCTQVVYTMSANSATVANMRALVNQNSTYIYFHTVGLGSSARITNSTMRTDIQGHVIILAGTYRAA
tara:strand:- start:390 stop:1055 length:666 start_codon:yes stop_codon:yes gene_type:complete